MGRLAILFLGAGTFTANYIHMTLTKTIQDMVRDYNEMLSRTRNMRI